jgi:hypothetical protein
VVGVGVWMYAVRYVRVSVSGSVGVVLVAVSE